MRPHSVISATRGLQIGLDLLLVGLVLFSTVAALSRHPSPARAAADVAVAVAFVGVYALGRRSLAPAERSARGPGAAVRFWIVGLIVAWLGLMILTPEALWVAFPLMFLQMHVLGPPRGIVAVVVTTAVAVAAGLWRDLSVVGAVLGPVIGACVAAGVIVGFEAIIHESRARQTLIDQLTRARTDLARAEHERGVATERERLSREIHDTLAQGLSSIELLLRVADSSIGRDDARARDFVDQARTAARENLAEARRFVRGLAPAPLAEDSLVGALGREAERVHAAGGPIVEVRAAGDIRPLPVATETALLRIGQSMLANAVQHAGARQVDIALDYRDDAVTLDVVDDGAGFDPVARTRSADGGYGLDAARSRAVELGGTLTIESSPGEGTAVAVVLPTDAGPHTPGTATGSTAAAPTGAGGGTQ